jgi:paraquat-inducible protein B
LFEGNHIGVVTDVEYGQDAKFVVDIRIEENFANAVTEHSRFFIIEDQAKQSKGLAMIQVRKGGARLEEGAMVEGSSKYAAVFGQIWDELGRKLDDLEKRFEEFSDDLKAVPDSEEVKQLQKELENLSEEMKQSSEAMRDKIQKEVLPRIQEEIEKLKEWLKEFGREEEVKPLETQLDMMREI